MRCVQVTASRDTMVTQLKIILAQYEGMFRTTGQQFLCNTEVSECVSCVCAITTVRA